MVYADSLVKSGIPSPSRMRPPRGGHGEMRMFFTFPLLFMWAVSTSYRFFIDQLKTDRENKERENIHLKTELSFLRSQISPHFIFNILNSLVALSRKRPQQVEPVIIQLSDMMRYMLYENDERKVSVAREIEYLENYIDLQKLRFGDMVKVNFSVYNDAGNKMIEPMLLIPYIENAFKHGVGLINNPVIDIHLRAEGNELALTVQNRFNDNDQKDVSSGIGLKNVERRLKILYDKRHQLRLSKDEEWFKVDLKIELE
ncbi:Sensor histidine kinase YpdA [compost metagenome]